MLIRVRSNVGVWRVDPLDELSATVSDVLEGIAASRPGVVYVQPLSRDPACKQHLDTTKTLTEQGFSHGSMIHCRVDAATTATATATASAAAAGGGNGNNKSDDGDVTMPDAAAKESGGSAAAGAGGTSTTMRRIIDKDGAIKLVPSNEVGASGKDRGFRKGMLPLRDMKMQWTLNDFMALDSQFTFKVQRQESAICKQVSLEVHAVTDFQLYLQRFQFQRKRIGYLYGTFVKMDGEKGNDKDKDDDKKRKATDGTTTDDDEKEKQKPPTKVIVEAIYEPPQDVDPDCAEGFVLADNAEEDEERAAAIAEMLGWRKVGWIFGHEPRKPGFVLSAAEVIMAAELQLEAAGGVEETPFVTVKVSAAAPTVAGGTLGAVSVEAFQVSQQCMAMVAEEALQVHPTDPAICRVHETFTLIQEGKESPTVDTNFFLTVVPIVQHASESWIYEFPRLHRELDDKVPSKHQLKLHLQKSGTAGWTFVDRLADFQLLLYLAKFLDVNADFPNICNSIINRDEHPLDDGYKLIIKSMAGMEGSY